MTERKPVAFLSYVRDDDHHDSHRITKLRERLEGEIRMQTGKPFPIFQDRNDLLWGQQWQERIQASLSDVTFLIPIITPSFFESPACREELSSFLLREETLGSNRLILPIYYVQADNMDEEFEAGKDKISDTLRARQWTDWRHLRFKDILSEEASVALAALAAMVKNSIRELGLILNAEQSATKSTTQLKQDRVLELEYESLNPPSVKQIKKRARTSARKVVVFKRDGITPYEIRPVTEDSSGATLPTPKSGYYVYTKRFDEVVDANSLSTPDDTLKLHRSTAALAEQLESGNRTALSMLENKLTKHNAEELSAVYILVDNSGSMRGTPIQYTSSWLQIVAPILERAGIRFEISGFTTRTWKGGQSRELWLADRRPPKPGRLNDLRYIVYKKFEDGFLDSATSISIMNREGLLKENIDGEAINWASQRLLSVEAKRRIVLVISDGAPVDDSTLSVNGPGFLQAHLNEIVSHLKDSKDFKFAAVGVGYDVSAVYGTQSRSVSEGDVGIGALEALEDAFSSAAAKQHSGKD